MIYKNGKKVKSIRLHTKSGHILFNEYPESHKIYYTTNDGNTINVVFSELPDDILDIKDFLFVFPLYYCGEFHQDRAIIKSPN